jgi:hypothetical protein
MALRWPPPLRPLPWTGLLVTLGLFLRSYHYLRNPSVWHDEAALVVNVLQKDYRELLGPLTFSEAAPPLFLWIERAVAVTLGDSTYALRLVPFLGSCLALLLFVPLARRLLAPGAVPWAVLFFACSDHLLWHACEAKPYALDVLAAVVLALLFLVTQGWTAERRLGLFAVLAPLVIFLTYPGCFLYGGVLLALLPALWRQHKPSSWLAYGGLALTVFVSFALLLTGPVRAQRDPTILGAWEGSFPDWSRPWGVPGWAFLATLEIFRYCVEPAGAVLAAFAVPGTLLLARRGYATVVVLLLVPIAAALAASFLRAYPYCGARILVYAAPGLVLLCAEGVPPVLAWLQARSRLATAAALLVLLAPAGKAGWNLVQPWARADCAGAAAYVLRHRQPDDRVTANHWEYEYYFRGLGEAYRPLSWDAVAANSRVWLVLTDTSATNRNDLIRAFTPPDWQAVEHREFEKTSVLLLQAPAMK